MTYSIDLRKSVVLYVDQGGSKAEASRVFNISLWCVNNWCKRENLAPKEYPTDRKRKLDWEALRRHVSEYPDAIFRERAKYFNVHIHTIEYAMKKMKITRKKNSTVQRKR